MCPVPRQICPVLSALYETMWLSPGMIKLKLQPNEGKVKVSLDRAALFVINFSSLAIERKFDSGRRVHCSGARCEPVQAFRRTAAANTNRATVGGSLYEGLLSSRITSS